MALQTLEFTFPGGGKPLSAAWSHTGVVGSGDMEVLLSHRALDGQVAFKVVTPVRGFDEIWQRVLARFVAESGIADALIEINDNNATPYVVATRLRQALLEAEEVAHE